MVVYIANSDVKPVTSWKFWTQRRYILALLAFFGYFNIYALRVNMSIGIVAMTGDRYSTLENGTETNIGPEFTWDNVIQGYVLSAFFYGYVTTQLLGGVLGRKFGGKFIFGGGIATTAFITLISPWLAEWSVYALLVARILMGIFEGVTFSSLYTIWSRWIPPLERTRMISQVQSGCYIGTVFSMMFFAYLASVAGWRSIFWFSGGLGLVWFLAWVLLIAERPETDSKMSKSELQYIQLTLEQPDTAKKYTVQWKSVLICKAVWAISISAFCEAWGFYTLLTLLPKYFKDVFKYDISKSGLLSALPYIAIAIMMPISGQIADRIIIKKWLTVSQTRKSFVTIGFFAQTGFMMGAAYWESAAGTVFCLVMAVGLGSLAIVTMCVNNLDIAPLHSGVVIGITNSWGTVPGILSPIAAGYIVSTENPTVEQWRIVFFITASLYLFGAVIYLIFGSGDRQSWDIEIKNIEFDDSTQTKEVNEIVSAKNGGLFS